MNRIQLYIARLFKIPVVSEHHKATIQAAYERSNSGVVKRRLSALHREIFGAEIDDDRLSRIVFGEEITASSITVDRLRASSISADKLCARPMTEADIQEREANKPKEPTERIVVASASVKVRPSKQTKG